MRGMLAPLSPHEEIALRKVGYGDRGPLEPDHIRRLSQLDLIEWDGSRWTLTATGEQRHAAVTSDEVPNPTQD